MDGKQTFKRRIKKSYVVFFLYLHAACVYGLYLASSGATKWQTIAFSIFMTILSITAVSAGLHRLWSHRSYKAKLPLQILLTIMTSIAYQYSTITWVRYHRIHHKYSDTDADPHNSRKGLFFSHIGWLLLEKHPDVKRKSDTIDLSDVFSNPVLRFQHENKVFCVGLWCYLLPTLTPLMWGETLSIAWHLNLLRYLVSLHITWLVNSAAHRWGYRPYDQNIAPTHSTAMSIVTLGEGSHNFHHTFPCDYRSAELVAVFALSTKFIEFFSWVGWAYDLKTTPPEIVRDRMKRTGDGSLL